MRIPSLLLPRRDALTIKNIFDTSLIAVVTPQKYVFLDFDFEEVADDAVDRASNSTVGTRTRI